MRAVYCPLLAATRPQSPACDPQAAPAGYFNVQRYRGASDRRREGHARAERLPKGQTILDLPGTWNCLGKAPKSLERVIFESAQVSRVRRYDGASKMTNISSANEQSGCQDIFKPNQMSARLLIKYAQSALETETNPEKGSGPVKHFCCFTIFISRREATEYSISCFFGCRWFSR